MTSCISLRLLCTLEGTYLVQENCADMTGRSDSSIEHDQIQSLSFSCVLPDIIGRGFIEVIPLLISLFPTNNNLLVASPHSLRDDFVIISLAY